MTAWIFSLALLVALGAAGAKAVGRRWQRRRARRSEGRSPDAPLVVSSFHEIDRQVEAARCTCGGKLVALGEGSRSTPLGDLRVVRCECAFCEEEVDLFFHIPPARTVN